MEPTYVAPEDLVAKLGDKQNLYEMITTDMGFYLPPESKCAIKFMKQILSKEKKVLLNSEVSMFPIPRYKELGVKPVWSLVSQVKELTDYFPDFKEKEVPDCSFLWGVLGTLKRDACEQLLNEARAQRSAGAEQKQDELIQMDRSFLEKIMKAPNMSKVAIFDTGKGRVAYLLKKSHQDPKSRKPPKEFPAKLSLLKMSHNFEERKQPPNRTLFRNEIRTKSNASSPRSTFTSQRKLTDMGFKEVIVESPFDGVEKPRKTFDAKMDDNS